MNIETAPFSLYKAGGFAAALQGWQRAVSLLFGSADPAQPLRDLTKSASESSAPVTSRRSIKGA